jgi:rabenosyn-5
LNYGLGSVPGVQGRWNPPRPLLLTHSSQSKRHSRTLSSQPSSTPLSTSPPSRPPSSASFVSPLKELQNGESVNDTVIQRPRRLSVVEPVNPAPPVEPSPPAASSGSSPQTLSVPVPSSHNGTSSESFPIAGSSVVAPAPAPVPKTAPTARKTSTFRRIPLREARQTIPASPLRSSHSQPPSAPSSTQSPLKLENNLPALNLEPPASATQSPVEPVRSPSPPPPKPPPKTPTSDSPTPRALSPQSRPTSAPPAPRPSTRFYRPGFQPRGVYRPRTDLFFEARKAKRDSGRIETTRLERRLEKLISLHFSDAPEKPIQAPPIRERRASFFEMDFSDLRNKSAGELWKGVLQSQAPSGKGDLRGRPSTYLKTCLIH